MNVHASDGMLGAGPGCGGLHLSEDIGEQHNMADEHPEQAARAEQLFG